MRLLWFISALVIATGCGRPPQPYRIHRDCHSRCPGLSSSESRHLFESQNQHEKPGCVITFEYNRSSQAPFRLWITDLGGEEETAYVDVFSEETGVATFALALNSEWSDWFRNRCSDVLKPIVESEQNPKCRVYDGNWIYVGQRSGSEWHVGESFGPAPDSELYELQEAALALVAAVASPSDIRAAHLVRLHTIISATERYLVPGSPRGAACEWLTPDEVAKRNARMTRELQRKCGDQVLRNGTPSFSRACEETSAKNKNVPFD